MMSKILLLGLILSGAALAQDASEEAIILNQELQFLEEAANNVSVTKVTSDNKIQQERSRPINTDSLERQYFGEDSDDVTTRAAAPVKRRSY